MGFLNKLKKSVSDAGTMAKVTVEVNRLKLQISSIKKDIGEQQTSIGKLIYEQYMNDTDRMDEVKALCEQIKEKYEEIDDIQQKIIEINGEKKCECGATLPVNTRFCSQCGHKFEDEDNVTEDVNSDAAAIAPVALEGGTVEETVETGQSTSEQASSTLVCKACLEPMEEDARFCEHCGAPAQQ